MKPTIALPSTPKLKPRLILSPNGPPGRSLPRSARITSTLPAYAIRATAMPRMSV